MSIQIISPLVSKGGKKKIPLTLSLQPVFCIPERRPKQVFTRSRRRPRRKLFSPGLLCPSRPGGDRVRPACSPRGHWPQTPRGVCLFKFQLRGWETAPLGAQAGWRLRARSRSRSRQRAAEGSLGPRAARRRRRRGAGRRGPAEEGRKSEPGRERRRARSRARARRPQQFSSG